MLVFCYSFFFVDWNVLVINTKVHWIYIVNLHVYVIVQKLCHDQGNNSSPDTFDLLILRSIGKVHRLSNWPHCLTLLDVLFVCWGRNGGYCIKEIWKINDPVTKAMGWLTLQWFSFKAAPKYVSHHSFIQVAHY